MDIHVGPDTVKSRSWMKIPRVARCQTRSVSHGCESIIRAEASSYQWNTGKPKCPLENQDVDAGDDDLDMPDFAAMIVDFEGPKRI